MTDYWGMCDRTRSIADRFAVESIKTAMRYKWWNERINKLAAEKLGVRRNAESWGRIVLRPIALGAPEYQVLIKRPGVIEENYDMKKSWSKTIYLFGSKKTIRLLGYGWRPFYLLAGSLSESLKTEEQVKIHPTLESAGLDAGLLDKPWEYHDQRVFSFALFYFFTLHEVYRGNKEYIAPASRKEGNRQVNGRLGIACGGVYLKPEEELDNAPWLTPHKSRTYDYFMIYTSLVFTPCEVYDALQLLAKVFTPLIYEAPDLGGLVVIDQHHLEKSLKGPVSNPSIYALLIEPNNPNRAEENVELVTVSYVTLDPPDVPQETIPRDEIDSPKALYEAAVLARLD